MQAKRVGTGPAGRCDMRLSRDNYSTKRSISAGEMYWTICVE